jgi:hypothetical protein
MFEVSNQGNLSGIIPGSPIEAMPLKPGKLI